MVLWNLLRWALSLVGVLVVRRIQGSSATGSRWLAFWFHGFVTCPAMLQSLIQLVRATVNLTRRETRWINYYHIWTIFLK